MAHPRVPSPVPSRRAAPVVCLVSLGCAKNTVDSERALGALAQDGWLIAADPADADLCLVNTCGFIAAARAETAATLRALARNRRRGRPSRIAALGCLVERTQSQPEFAELLAAADAHWTFADYPRLPRLARALLGIAPPRADEPAPDFEQWPRLVSGAPHSVWLKIAEGCSNRCHFCAIPLIRGARRSRPPAEIVAEADALRRGGAREINLIAQDTAAYGRDIGADLPSLLRALLASPHDAWLRLLYMHPRHVTASLLDALAGDPRVCPYLDLPLQHIADRLLRAMGRRHGERAARALLERLRARYPRFALRTTFIVGFPGETEREFQALEDLVAAGWFDHVGVFTYSPEPGTRAASLADTVPAAEKARRGARLMAVQRAVSRRKLRALIGCEVTALVDGPGARAGAWRARTMRQAPEVDGMTRLRAPPDAVVRPGDRVRARVTGATDHDLRADVIGPAEGGRP